MILLSLRVLSLYKVDVRANGAWLTLKDSLVIGEWIWNFIYHHFFCHIEANSWLASCSGGGKRKTRQKSSPNNKSLATFSHARPRFKPELWWETASSQWKCLRSYGLQGRPLVVGAREVCFESRTLPARLLDRQLISWKPPFWRDKKNVYEEFSILTFWGW